MKRLLCPRRAGFYACILACSFALLSSCKKTAAGTDTPAQPIDTVVAQAAASAGALKGLNWADPNDNFSTGYVVPSGLSTSDTYAATQLKANTILAAFQQQGANTVRLPVNPITVGGTWWAAYTGAIDAAVSKKMNVILAYWESSGSGSGRVDDMTAFWNMWQTVTNKYRPAGNVFFEIFNEPHGYSVSDLSNLYVQWLAKYPSIPTGRVLLDGAGYATNVNEVGADTRLSGCLLSYHNYTWYSNSLTTSADWQGSLQSVAYPSRTVMTEFGIPMTTGNDYLGAPGSNRDIAYFQGVTNQLRASGMGCVYWPGLRTGDTYSLLTLSGSTLSVNNPGGVSRLQYAWGGAAISQPAAVFAAGTWYKLVNRNSSAALDINGQATTAGAGAVQWAYWGGNNQQWSFSSPDSGFYKITNRNSGLPLDVSGASTANGASVIQGTAGTGTNQKWEVTDIGFGYYQLLNHNSGQSLDVNGGSTANGANIIQWPANGGRNQQWQITGL